MLTRIVGKFRSYSLLSFQSFLFLSIRTQSRGYLLKQKRIFPSHEQSELAQQSGLGNSLIIKIPIENIATQS